MKRRRHLFSKKNPNRKQLKKIKELQQRLDGELGELVEGKKTVQLLTASLRREKDDAAIARSSAMEQEHRARMLEQHAREELQSINKYHPSLMAHEYIGGNITDMTMSDILQFRMASPTIDWHDADRKGAVKMVFGKTNAGHEMVAYGLSEDMIVNAEDSLFDYLVKDMSETIARELVMLARDKLRK